MKKEVIIEACIALIILLFAYTAVSKALDYEKFVFQMKLAPLPLMNYLAPSLGVFLPLIEFGIVVLLLFKRFRLKGLYSTVALLMAFEIYIGGMMLSGSKLPCTCGGIISKMGWGQHLLFNLVFIAIAIAAITLIKTDRPFKSVNKVLSRA